MTVRALGFTLLGWLLGAIAMIVVGWPQNWHRPDLLNELVPLAMAPLSPLGMALGALIGILTDEGREERVTLGSFLGLMVLSLVTWGAVAYKCMHLDEPLFLTRGAALIPPTVAQMLVFVAGSPSRRVRLAALVGTLAFSLGLGQLVSHGNWLSQLSLLLITLFLLLGAVILSGILRLVMR